MADKDFNIQDDFAAIGVTVNVHSFLKKNSVQQRRNGTQQDLRLRIHVESCIERIKNLTYI